MPGTQGDETFHRESRIERLKSRVSNQESRIESLKSEVYQVYDIFVMHHQVYDIFVIHHQVYDIFVIHYLVYDKLPYTT